MKTEFAAKARNVAMEALKLSGMLCRHSFAFAKRISIACGKTAAECYRAAKPRVITEISQTAVRLRKLSGTVCPNEFGVDPKEKERKRYFAPPQAIQAAPAVQTVEDRLEKIAYLKANGVLSDEEYEEARKKILSEL